MKIKELDFSVLQEFLELLKSSKDLAVDNFPALIQEALHFEIIKNYIICSLLPLAIILTIVALIVLWFFRTCVEEDAFLLTLTIGGFASLVTLLPFAFGIIELIKITLAPRIFMIDYLVRFLRRI